MWRISLVILDYFWYFKSFNQNYPSTSPDKINTSLDTGGAVKNSIQENINYSFLTGVMSCSSRSAEEESSPQRQAQGILRAALCYMCTSPKGTPLSFSNHLFIYELKLSNCSVSINSQYFYFFSVPNGFYTFDKK